MNIYCQCRSCKRAKRKGKILGSRLLSYFGPEAHFVSDYVPYHKWRKGRRPLVGDSK